MLHKRIVNIRFAVALTLSVLSVQAVQAQVVVTIDGPGVQSSTVSGITTETFDGFTPGFYTTLNTAVGTYSGSGFEVAPANVFGGAGGTGNYFAVGAESGTSSETLTLPSDQGYFGFWFSAGDSANEIQLYENSTLEYTLDTAGLINFINKQSDVSAYYGNPNNGGDGGEPFAYVNFFGTHGTVFNTIVFSNASLGSGFESDNHSIALSAPVSGIPISSVPEPGCVALLASVGLTGAALLRRRTR